MFCTECSGDYSLLGSVSWLHSSICSPNYPAVIVVLNYGFVNYAAPPGMTYEGDRGCCVSQIARAMIRGTNVKVSKPPVRKEDAQVIEHAAPTTVLLRRTADAS